MNRSLVTLQGSCQYVYSVNYVNIQNFHFLSFSDNNRPFRYQASRDVERYLFYPQYNLFSSSPRHVFYLPVLQVRLYRDLNPLFFFSTQNCISFNSNFCILNRRCFMFQNVLTKQQCHVKMYIVSRIVLYKTLLTSLDKSVYAELYAL